MAVQQFWFFLNVSQAYHWCSEMNNSLYQIALYFNKYNAIWSDLLISGYLWNMPCTTMLSSDRNAALIWASSKPIAVIHLYWSQSFILIDMQLESANVIIKTGIFIEAQYLCSPQLDLSMIVNGLFWNLYWFRATQVFGWHLLFVVALDDRIRIKSLHLIIQCNFCLGSEPGASKIILTHELLS